MTIISLGQESLTCTSLTCTASPMQMCTNLKTYDWRQRLHFTMKQCAQNPTVAYINGHANLRIGNIIRDCRIGHDARRWRPAACQKPRKTKTRQASDRRRGKLTTTTTIMTMTMRAMAAIFTWTSNATALSSTSSTGAATHRSILSDRQTDRRLSFVVSLSRYPLQRRLDS